MEMFLTLLKKNDKIVYNSLTVTYSSHKVIKVRFLTFSMNSTDSLILSQHPNAQIGCETCRAPSYLLQNQCHKPCHTKTCILVYEN